MKKLLLSVFMLLGFLAISVAGEDILFSVGDTKVSRQEFEYIYNKNNFNNKANYSRESLEDYLQLYVNFRLKVKEAEAQGLDTSARFKTELAAYEKQLLEAYVEKAIFDSLVYQEYQRGQKDVCISHIFISHTQPNGADAAALAKDYYQKIKAGTAYNEMAKLSDDKQTASKNGNIGWFNSYQISFAEIEDAVYAMKPGEISAPVKTRIGYHILRLDSVRIALPKIKAAIIKRYYSPTDTGYLSEQSAKAAIDAAYAELKKNVPFEQVVQNYSEDESSRSNKGVLDWFGINTYHKKFEESVYALKDGAYSAPFKTATAWYIVKRLETAPVKPFESVAPSLKAKLQSLQQYQHQIDKFIEQLSEKWKIAYFPAATERFQERLNRIALTTPFVYKDTLPAAVILKIGDKEITENQLGKNIQSVFYTVNPGLGTDKISMLVKNAIHGQILEQYKQEIKTTHPEFKMLMNEYRNGIMIFNLSESNVWEKASADTAGLRTYYNLHKEDFKAKKKATLRTFYANNAKQAKSLYKLVAKKPDMTDEEMKSNMISLGIVEPEVHVLSVDEESAKSKLEKAFIAKPSKQGSRYLITQLYNIQPERMRALEECRGYVVAAYQEELEKKWVDELRKKYPVVIEEQVLDSMIKK